MRDHDTPACRVAIGSKSLFRSPGGSGCGPGGAALGGTMLSVAVCRPFDRVDVTASELVKRPCAVETRTAAQEVGGLNPRIPHRERGQRLFEPWQDVARDELPGWIDKDIVLRPQADEPAGATARLDSRRRNVELDGDPLRT